MSKIILQAHRGVSTEFPENTMSAFRAAKKQGYGIIELDPAVTSDGVFVIHHDKTVMRTARNADGTKLSEKKVGEYTYAELSELDFGIWFSKKFEGEHIPNMDEVLLFSEKENIPLKIDNKIMSFSDEQIEAFFSLIKKHNAPVGFTSNSLEFTQRVCDNFIDCEIHYDGKITEEILASLKKICGERLLTVWAPIRFKGSDWVKVDFLSKELAELIKKYARLGVWIVSKYEQLDEAEAFGADVVETTGSIKPDTHFGIVDCHTHTNHSHDSKCEMDELIAVAKEKGLSSVTVTDHCDVMTDPKVYDGIKASIEHANSLKGTLGEFRVFSGSEIGEYYSKPDVTKAIIDIPDCDAVIGSVHAVRGARDHEKYFSGIDFLKYSEDELYKYIDCYFDDVLDMVKNLPCDIMAHLTCPIRYINGKYGRDIKIDRYMPKIETILKETIKRGIAMEINTSGIGGALDDFMPDEAIIRLYRELGGYMVTLGSDCHAAKNVACGFEKLTELLKEIGYRDAFYFENRTPMAYKI